MEMALIVLGITASAILLLAWRFPMAGAVLAVNAYVFRSPYQHYILQIFPDAPKREIIYSAVAIIPPLAVLCIRMTPRLIRLVSSTGLHWQRLHVVDASVIVLGMVLLLGSLYAPDQGLAFGICLKYFALSFPLFVIGRVWFLTTDTPEKEGLAYANWTWALAGGAAAIGLVGSARDLLGPFANIRLSTLGAVAIPFAMLMGGAVIVTSYYLWRRADRTWLIKGSLIGSLALFLIVLVLSGSRGVFLSLLVSLALMGVLLSRPGRYSLSTILLLIGGLLALAFCAFYAMPHEIQRDVAVQMHFLLTRTESIHERMMYWTTALDLIRESPFLGIGTGGFTHYVGGYPHNVLLELAAENGLPGIAAALLFGVGVLLAGVRGAFRTRDPVCCLYASWTIFFLCCAQLSMTLFMLKHLFFTAGVLISLTEVSRSRASLDEMPSRAGTPAHESRIELELDQKSGVFLQAFLGTISAFMVAAAVSEAWSAVVLTLILAPPCVYIWNRVFVRTGGKHALLLCVLLIAATMLVARSQAKSVAMQHVQRGEAILNRWTVALEHGDDMERWAAAKAMLNFGDSRGISRLVSVLIHGTEDARRDSIQALGGFGGSEAINPLQKFLSKHHNDPLRPHVIDAIRRIQSRTERPGRH